MQNSGAIPAVDVEDLALPVTPAGGRVLVRIFRARGAAQLLPVVLCVPACGVRDDGYDHLARGLASGVSAAVLVAEESGHPDPLELLCAVLLWVSTDGARRRLDGTRIAVVEEGRRALGASLSSLLIERSGPALRGLVSVSDSRAAGALHDALTALQGALI